MRFNSLYETISVQHETWGDTIPKEKKVFSVLMMGYGGPGHEGAYLTDTMMVLQFDIEKKRGILISIPRDVWVKIPTDGDEEFERKINATYQIGLFKEKYPAVPQKYAGDHGASELVKEIVEDIVGFEIDHYLTIDFEGFRKAIDTLGGVDVDVERSFIDAKYPVTGKEDDLCDIDENDEEQVIKAEEIATESPELAYPCRYEALSFNAGLNKMDGDTALKFVRSRYALEDGGDFNRARRQQVFLEAVRSKVLSIGFIPKIIPLMNDLEDHVRTDIPLELTNKLLKEFLQSEDYEINQIVLTTDNYLEHDVSSDGQYILIPKDGLHRWNDLHKDIENSMLGITPTPTPIPELSPGA